VSNNGHGQFFYYVISLKYRPFEGRKSGWEKRASKHKQWGKIKEICWAIKMVEGTETMCFDYLKPHKLAQK
jgi:hypothetical protein